MLVRPTPLIPANNLSDLPNKPLAISNLGAMPQSIFSSPFDIAVLGTDAIAAFTSIYGFAPTSIPGRVYLCTGAGDAGEYTVRISNNASPVIGDQVIGSEMEAWNGTSEVYPAHLGDIIDGTTELQNIFAAMLAFMNGQSSVVNNDDGTQTLTFLKRDGATTAFTCRFNSQTGVRETAGTGPF